MTARVSFPRRLAYALPAAALAGATIPAYVFVPQFYTDVVGVSMVAVSNVLVAGRLIDAISDPLIGELSDRTRTRWGRRRPWIVGMSIPLALAILFLFAPRVEGPAATAWFATCFSAFFLFFTAVYVPYCSLGLELSDDYEERTSVLGLRDGVGVVGILLAGIAPLVITWALGLAPGKEGERTRMLALAAVWAPMTILLAFVCAFGTRERPLAAPSARGRRPGFIELLKNRPFAILLAAYTVNAIGSNLPANFMPYYVTYYLGSTNTPAFLGLYCTAGILCMPLWVRLARPLGKRGAWIAAMAVNSGAFLLVFLVERGAERAYGLLVTLSGIGFGGTLILPSSMQADVADYDELLSGERREGRLVGLWTIACKLAAALGIAAAFQALAWAGYVPNAPHQSERVELTLRVVYILVPSACTLVAIALAWAYPIDRQVHQRVLDALVARKEGREHTDPLAAGTTP